MISIQLLHGSSAYRILAYNYYTTSIQWPWTVLCWCHYLAFRSKNILCHHHLRWFTHM